jgi:hypothetical protein
MTFAVLLYVNVFYFGLYSMVEFCILLTKGYSLTDSRYTLAAFINELFILAFMVIVESLRLFLGQQYTPVRHISIKNKKLTLTLVFLNS